MSLKSHSISFHPIDKEMTRLNIRQNNQGSKKNKNMVAYEKEILVNSTKVVVLLTRNNLHF